MSIPYETKQHNLLPKQISLSVIAIFLPALPPSTQKSMLFFGAILNFLEFFGILTPL